jgi:hypothetical protein
VSEQPVHLIEVEENMQAQHFRLQIKFTSKRRAVRDEGRIRPGQTALLRPLVQFPGFASQSQILTLSATEARPSLNSQPSTMIQLNQERHRQRVCGPLLALQWV